LGRRNVCDEQQGAQDPDDIDQGFLSHPNSLKKAIFFGQETASHSILILSASPAV
jgi:hypothetical protein